MRVAQMIKAKLIDPIIDQIVNRVGDRVSQLLDNHSCPSSKAQKDSDAQRNAAETAKQDRDLVARENDKIESMSYAKVIGELAPPQYPPPAPRRRSELCKQAD